MTQDMNHMKEKDWTPERCDICAPNGDRCFRQRHDDQPHVTVPVATNEATAWDLLAADRQKLAKVERERDELRGKLNTMERTESVELDALRGKLAELDGLHLSFRAALDECCDILGMSGSPELTSVPKALRELLAQMNGEKSRLIEALANEQDQEENAHRKYERAERENKSIAAKLSEIRHERDGLRTKLEEERRKHQETANREADLMRQLAAKDDAEPQPCTDCADKIEELEAVRERLLAELAKMQADMRHEAGYSQELVNQSGEMARKLQRLRKDRNRWRKVAMRLAEGGAA